MQYAEIKTMDIIGLRKNLIVKNKIYSKEEVYEAIKDHLFDAHTKEKKGKKNFTFLVKHPVRVVLDGEEIKANSQRLQLFYTKGFKCVVCGTEGKFFIMVRAEHEKRFHLELVGETPDGKLVMMTKDHIVPKSLGGKDELENYQTMCVTCNCEKGNAPDPYIKGDIEELRKANRALFNENKELKAELAKYKALVEQYKTAA